MLVFLQFPNCTDEEAISVACLDLHYYVTVHENMQHTKKDETHMPVALSDLQGGEGGDITEQDDVKSMFRLHLFIISGYACMHMYTRPMLPYFPIQCV